MVGTKERFAQTGDVIVTPPHTTHFTIPDKDFVIAIVNTPSFNVNNYVSISETDYDLAFDRQQFDRLVNEKCR